MCHHNSFLLYSALEGATQQRWERVTHASIAASFLVMLVFALGGYVTFLDETQGDLLNNYCWRDDLMNACRFLFAVTIMLTYPIECFVCREVVENILFRRIGLLAGGEDEAKWKVRGAFEPSYLQVTTPTPSCDRTRCCSPTWASRSS